jgi:hypothetical protein
VSELEQTRKTPNFNTELALSAIKGGLVTIVVTSSILYWLLRILFRGHLEVIWTVEFWAHWYNWIIPFLFMFGMPLVAIFVYLDIVTEAFSVILGKYKWINTAARAKAIIVDKRMREDWEYREDYSYHVLIPELRLKYSPTLAIMDASEQAFWASVNPPTYAKYELQDVVDIFYSISDPSVFVIEGE